MGLWIIDTAGIGSIIVFAVGFSTLAAYLYMLRWIQTAPPEPAAEPGERAIETGGQAA
ncbi:MAG: hypothetical protein AB1801_02655 [Chloroflexota bacterium]